jgi:hypothetical protein
LGRPKRLKILQHQTFLPPAASRSGYLTRNWSHRDQPLIEDFLKLESACSTK